MKIVPKKALSIFLMLLLVFGAIPIQASANDEYVNGLKVTNTTGANSTTLNKLENGEVWMDKSVEYVGNGNFEVTLKAAGRRFPKTGAGDPVDVVLVLDTSGSMSDNNKMTSMKNAAKNAVDAIIKNDNNNRVALVEYSATATKVLDFTRDKNTSNNSGLKKRINDLTAVGGTNIQHGFYIAQKAINDRHDNYKNSHKPVIILLTDGQPTYYYKKTDLNNATRTGYGYVATKDAVAWTVKQAKHAKDNVGKSINTGGSGQELRIYTIGFDINSIKDGYEYYQGLIGRNYHDQDSQKNAVRATLKPDKNNLSGGYDASSYLSPWDNGYKYWEPESALIDSSSANELNAIFDKIVKATISVKPQSYTESGGERHYSDIVLEDIIGEGFEYVSRVTPPNQAGTETLKAEDNVVTWTIPGDEFKAMPYAENESQKNDINNSDIHEIKFKVKLKNGVGAETYNTNQRALLNFNKPDDSPWSGSSSLNNSNTGSITLEEDYVDISITIKKVVKGPASGERDFSFDYWLEDGERKTETITVNGIEAGEETVTLQVPGSALAAAGSSVRVYAKETSTTNEKFWTYDNVKQSKEITKNDSSAVFTFTNTYDPKGSLKVIKDWDGGPKADEVTFELWKVGEDTVFGEGTLNGVNDWTFEFDDLELGTYRIVETPVPDDYGVSYIDESEQAIETIVIGVGNLNREVTIVNTYKPPTGEITISKTWNDSDNAAGDRPEKLYVKYYGPGKSHGKPDGWVVLTGDSEGIWSKTITVSKEGTYTFVEYVPKDYSATARKQTAKMSFASGSDRTASVKFNNEYIEPKGEVTVTKEWEGDDNNQGYRPDKITVELTKTDIQEGDAPIFNIELSNENSWEGTFENLDFGTYKIEEVKVNDYTTSYENNTQEVTITKDGERTAGITIINTFDNPTGKITVTKQWIESSKMMAGKVRPKTIEIQLYKGGVAQDGPVVLGGTGDEWSHTFTGLSLDGKYTVKELSVNDYESVVEYTEGASEDDKSIELNKETRTGEILITNTNAEGTIKVIKTWNHKNNPWKERPNSVKVTLYQRVETVEVVEPDVEGDEQTEQTNVVTNRIGTKTIKKSNVAVFYGLDIGEGISYYVEEEGVPFYTTKYSVHPNNPPKYLSLSEDSPNGRLVVTNTYKDPRGSLTVKKDWEHGYNPINKQPKSVTVQLYKNGSSYGKPVKFSDNYTFHNLPLGYKYTVVEKPVKGYETDYNEFTSYKPVKGDGTVASGNVTITNSYISEVGDLTVTKKWIPKVGEPIKITLSRFYKGENGDGIKDENFNPEVKVLGGEEPWSFTYKNLELYGPGGVPYSYKATESSTVEGGLTLYKEINNNTPNLIKGKANIIIITNKYAPHKGKLTIKKEWYGENGEKMDPPVDKIKVRLVINGKAERSSMVLSSKNNWTVVRKHLDVDKNYSVKEVTGLEEFNVSYDPAGRIEFDANNLEKEIVVKNTRTADNPILKVTKEVDKPEKPLTDGNATFTYKITIKNVGNRTLKDFSIADVMEGPDNSKIVYNSEPEFDGSLAPEKEITIVYSVTVDKSGKYDNEVTVTGKYNDIEVEGSDKAEVTVKQPGLTITKEVVGPSTLRGNSGTFSYKLTVDNSGEVDLENVKVVDGFSGSPDVKYNYSGELDFNEETGEFTIGELKSKDNVVITYTVTVSKTGTYDNIATVTGDYSEEDDESGDIITKTLEDSDDVSVILRARSSGGGGDPDPKDPEKPDPEKPDPEKPDPDDDDETGVEGDYDEDEDEDDETGILGDEDVKDDDTGILGGSDTPKTGDATPIVLLFGMLVTSIAGIYVLMRRRKNATH